MNTDALIEIILRWGHVASGIVWIGILYFFNFVNGPFQGKLSADAKKEVVRELMPRALWWFRWGAMSTFLFGIALFVYLYLHQSQLRQGGEGISGRALWIMWGMTFGTIMWFNVWFIIWPAQRQIIPAVSSGQAPPAGLPARAARFSRINTYLSGPMLFMMFAAPHYSAFDWALWAILVAVGFLAIHLCIKAGPKVGHTV